MHGVALRSTPKHTQASAFAQAPHAVAQQTSAFAQQRSTATAAMKVFIHYEEPAA